MIPLGVAFSVAAGVVLARYGDTPVGFLTRPLLVAAVVGVVVGALSMTANRPVTVAALSTLVVVNFLWGVLAVALAGVVSLVTRIRQANIDPEPAVAIGALTFLLAGAIPVVPALWDPATAETSTSSHQPVFLILLDGYPRIDSLAELGIDNSGFVAALEARGFDHYPDAYTLHGSTKDTFTEMLGDPWRLPSGFVTVAPPMGDVAIPDTRTIGQQGISDLEIALIAKSIAGPFAESLVMDGLRSHLDKSLDALGSTDERMVFAHIMAPHPPFLWGASYACYPGCNIFVSTIEQSGMTLDDWATGMRETVEHLNPKLLDTVDSIIARHPDATVALFSDHGGRYSITKDDEWLQSFLAVRGPDLPDPRPSALLEALVG